MSRPLTQWVQGGYKGNCPWCGFVTPMMIVPYRAEKLVKEHLMKEHVCRDVSPTSVG